MAESGGLVSGLGHDLAHAAGELRWPTGHTTAQLDAAELGEHELNTVADLLRMGRHLTDVYRRRLRALGRSWIGIPTAEQTPGRMARVLVLLSRPQDVKAGCTFPADCRTLGCEEDHGGHHITITLN